MSQVDKKNFVEFINRRPYDSDLVIKDLGFIVMLALKKNRFPPSSYAALNDLVGEMFIELYKEPPCLDNEDWFIQLYRQARRVTSRYFKISCPPEETVQDPEEHLIHDYEPEDESRQVLDFEPYIDSLRLDDFILDAVYEYFDKRVAKEDPMNMDFSVFKVTLLAVIF